MRIRIVPRIHQKARVHADTQRCVHRVQVEVLVVVAVSEAPDADGRHVTVRGGHSVPKAMALRCGFRQRAHPPGPDDDHHLLGLFRVLISGVRRWTGSVGKDDGRPLCERSDTHGQSLRIDAAFEVQRAGHFDFDGRITGLVSKLTNQEDGVPLVRRVRGLQGGVQWMQPRARTGDHGEGARIDRSVHPSREGDGHAVAPRGGK